MSFIIIVKNTRDVASNIQRNVSVLAAPLRIHMDLNNTSQRMQIYRSTSESIIIVF